MKLISLKLEDFQAHEALEIKFDSGITTIVGATDVGKSAVLRALRVLCLNDIAGTHFVRDGAKRMSITLEGYHQKEKHTVVRTKNKDGATNTYELDGNELKAFGQGVPTDVVNFLRLAEINFQDQHDSPFWFKETGGEVSKRLNAVVDLSVIDTTLSNIAGAVKIAQTKKEAAEERLEAAEFKLAGLEKHRGRIDDFTALMDAHTTYQKVKRRHMRIGEVLDAIQEHKTSADRLQKQATEGGEMLTAAGLVHVILSKVVSLDSLIQRIQKQEAAVSNAPPDFAPVEKAFNTMRKVGEDYGELNALIRKTQEAEKRRSDWVDEASKRETRFHLKTKDMNCPLCGKVI